MIKRYFIFIVFIVCSWDLAQAESCSDSVRVSDYMASWQCYLAREPQILGKPEQWLFDQNMATLLSFVGEEKTALKIFERLSKTSPSFDEIQTADFLAKNAKDEIAARVADKQIVLINEAHHVPQTRLLTLQLLQSFYDQGFRYFAAETFDERTLQKNIRQGFPTQDIGYYTAEPTFALIVREALRIGYKLIAYEFIPPCDPFKDPPEKCQNLREEGQAKNIFERVFKDDSKAKILVHAGYGHIDKIGQENWLPMGYYLWNLAKIEPYSIDLTSFYQHAGKELDSKLYRQVIGKYKIHGPTILVDKNTREVFVAPRYRFRYNVQVFLPELSEIEERQTWKQLIPGIKKIHLKNLNCPKNSKCLVQAIVQNELQRPAQNEKDFNFIPMDQLILRGKSAVLYLPSGNYELRLVNDKSKILWKRPLFVP